jgi:hypothetical protein
MASGLVSAFGGGDAQEPEKRSNPITEFKVGLADDSRGVPTLRALAKRADGSGSKFQNLIIYLDTPDAARALRRALPVIARAIDAVEKRAIELGDWKPEATTAAPAAAPAAPAAAPAAPKSKLSAAFDDLPW